MLASFAKAQTCPLPKLELEPRGRIECKNGKGHFRPDKSEAINGSAMFWKTSRAIASTTDCLTCNKSFRPCFTAWSWKRDLNTAVEASCQRGLSADIPAVLRTSALDALQSPWVSDTPLCLISSTRFRHRARAVSFRFPPSILDTAVCRKL